MPAFIALIITALASQAQAPSCAASGARTWSDRLLQVLPGCRFEVGSPDTKLTAHVSAEEEMWLALNGRRLVPTFEIEGPAMFSWSPTSKAFFISEDRGSGMTSVLRMFHVTAAAVREDSNVFAQAIRTYRKR